MPNSEKAKVLVVDDRPDDERSMVHAWDGEIEAEILHPQDVREEDLAEADLVVIDYRLEAWPERDNTDAIALQPINGLVLATILRAHAERELHNTTAFALRSACLEQLSKTHSSESREHIIAMQNNLEWAFPKETRGRNPLPQIVTLARSVRELPANWPTGDPEGLHSMVAKFFAIPRNESWAEQAWLDILECRPPIHDISEPPEGLRFLRWFLHRILPYPCFLMSEHYLAVRLRATYLSFCEALESGLRDVLEPYEFKGHPRDFLGNRWWRCGIESFLWDLTDGESYHPGRVRAVLSEKHGVRLEPLPVSCPVVCVDKDYQPLTGDFDESSAVQIQPDDWPTYADSAWATTALAKEDARIGALVIGRDRDKLDAVPELFA